MPYLIDNMANWWDLKRPWLQMMGAAPPVVAPFPLRSPEWIQPLELSPVWWNDIEALPPLPAQVVTPTMPHRPEWNEMSSDLSTYSYWTQQKSSAIAAAFNPPRKIYPLPEPLPDLGISWWELPRRSLYHPALVTVTTAQLGNYRVQNAIAGYNVYLGAGVLPDLTTAPAVFSASLPFNVALTPPGLGTQTYYILVRQQDVYGIESQNQYCSTFTIDTSGNLVMPALLAPTNLNVFQGTAGKLRVMAAYPGAASDQFPASSWKVWINTVLPNPGVDTPTAIVAVSGVNLILNAGPYSPGLLYVMVALFRATGGALSPTVYTTITINGPPAELIAVPSGFDVES
jgi:hypothetical protein